MGGTDEETGRLISAMSIKVLTGETSKEQA
jgi:hypothetical protein